MIAPATVRRRPALRLGTGIKLRCAILYNHQWPFFAEFWGRFDWTGYIKPCIDAARAIGANCIKFNVVGVSPDGAWSYPPDAVLRAELLQVCNYARSLGMLVYIQLGYQPQQSFGADGSGLAVGILAAQKIAAWADAIPNVVGIDLMNEWDVTQPSTWSTTGSGLTRAVSDLTAYATAVRAVTSLPLTISCLQIAAQAAVAPIVDYHDVHYYFYNGTTTFDPTYADTVRKASWYKGAFLLGETGMPDTYSPAVRAAWMGAVPSMTNDADCLGGCNWTLVDTYGAGLTPGNWGVFPQGKLTSPRLEMSIPFGTWPAHI